MLEGRTRFTREMRTRRERWNKNITLARCTSSPTSSFESCTESRRRFRSRRRHTQHITLSSLTRTETRPEHKRTRPSDASQPVKRVDAQNRNNKREKEREKKKQQKRRDEYTICSTRKTRRTLRYAKRNTSNNGHYDRSAFSSHFFLGENERTLMVSSFCGAFYFVDLSYNTDHIDLCELYAFWCHSSREDLIS